MWVATGTSDRTCSASSGVEAVLAQPRLGLRADHLLGAGARHHALGLHADQLDGAPGGGGGDADQRVQLLRGLAGDRRAPLERELGADLHVRALGPVPDGQSPRDALGERLDHRGLERAEVLQHLLHRVAEARHVGALPVGRQLDEEIERRVEEAAAVGETDDAVEARHARLVEPEAGRRRLLLHVALEPRGQAPLDPVDAARLPEGGEELGDRASEHRMPKVRRDVVKRDQDEAALGDARVRHLERVGADHAVTVEEDVDVDRARAVSLARAPPHPGLDPLHGGEEVGRLERGGALQREIQETGLVGHVHRLGLVDRRDPLDPDVRAEALERLGQVALAVSHVRPEPEVDGRRRRHGRPAPSSPPFPSASR